MWGYGRYQSNGQTNRRNFTNFKRNLAMMVIYLPVKFEFDWTNHVRVRVPKRKMWTDRQTDVGHINLIGGLVTRNPPNKNLSAHFFNIIIVIKDHSYPFQGSHTPLTTGFKVFSRIFKVNNNNSQGYILRHSLLYLPF